MPSRKDPSDRPLTPAGSRELQREFAADEHAARPRLRSRRRGDLRNQDSRGVQAQGDGRSDAARGSAGHGEGDGAPVLKELEKGWQKERQGKAFDVADYARSAPPVEKSRGPER